MHLDPSATLDPAGCATIGELDTSVTGCRACPRLVEWRERVAETKRAAYAGQTYWGRPVPGFGPPDAALAIVGLAPAAHGANRTGRMFTGDRSGEVLYAALHAVGLSSQASSTHRGDGLRLYGTRITAPVRCAPPENKPSTAEQDTCRPWLRRELELLAPNLRAVVALGGFGWQAVLRTLEQAGWQVPRPRPRFTHGARAELQPGEARRGNGPAPASPAPATPAPATRAPAALHLFGCYHVSQQNTFTGRLTPGMLQDVLANAASAAGLR